MLLLEDFPGIFSTQCFRWSPSLRGDIKQSTSPSVSHLVFINYSVDYCTQNVQMVLMYIKCTNGPPGALVKDVPTCSWFKHCSHRVSISVMDINIPQHMFLKEGMCQLISSSSGVSRDIAVQKGSMHQRWRSKFYSKINSAMTKLCESG